MEKLNEIKRDLDEGRQPPKVTVKTLLGWFHSERRGSWVTGWINGKLDSMNIETFPDFKGAYIHGEIEFRKKRKQRTPSKTNAHEEDELLNLNDPTYRISRLASANAKIEFVKPDSPLQEAVTKMITHDYSQLPVMLHEKRNLKGVISWKSIGLGKCLGNNSATVKDLMDKSFQLIPSDTSLFKAIPSIIEHDYVIVENEEREISGIVTASDLSFQFQELTEPFLLVAEIENHLRQILSKLDLEVIKKAKDERDETREITDVTDLTFGEYQRIFEEPNQWEAIGILIDRKHFCQSLSKVRKARNEIMHFDPDGLSESSIQELRNFVRLLQTLKNLKAI